MSNIVALARPHKLAVEGHRDARSFRHSRTRDARRRQLAANWNHEIPPVAKAFAFRRRNSAGDQLSQRGEKLRPSQLHETKAYRPGGLAKAEFRVPIQTIEVHPQDAGNIRKNQK